MIEVAHLTKRFGQRTAVEDVSFHADAGEAVGLLGPNGSGKTTIMRTLVGYFPPSSGRVVVAGVDVGADPLRAQAQLGYLPETATWYPELRVGEFLGLCADVRRLRGAARRARLDAVRAGCGLAEVDRRLIGTLSKGYKQRVGLAQALLHEPAVLILDEPTVGLDPRQMVEMRALVRTLRGRTTVLLSTHILSEVATTCDRVVIIDRGRLVAEDRADALARTAQQAQRLLVRVVGPAGEVAAALAGLAELSAVEPQPSDDGSVHLVATVRPGAAAAGAVAGLVLRRHWRLEEIRVLTPSLEELFVRLTGGEAAP
ncbi:MAG: ABC transporter ATP-binding protein [Deltaproteobacteria bacterium]|nr:ABC transporter ATP-binding protein [Deltaproteobacteria bacterium]